MTKDIERVQKRCLKVIYPTLSYSEALAESGLVRFAGLPWIWISMDISMDISMCGYET